MFVLLVFYVNALVFFLQFRARLWCSLEANSIAFTNRIGNISKCRSRVVTYHEDFLHIKPHGALITKSCEIMWQTKTISTIRVHMATKPGRMVTYLDTVSAPPPPSLPFCWRNNFQSHILKRGGSVKKWVPGRT